MLARPTARFGVAPHAVHTARADQAPVRATSSADYLAKPVQFSALRQMFARWADRGGSPAS